MVKTYLIYFPEESKDFWGYEQWMRVATQELYDAYCSIFKSHEKTVEQVHSKWRAHLYAIHGLHKARGKSILKADVVEYMNTQPVPRLLFLMNYDKRFGSGAAAGAGATMEDDSAPTPAPVHRSRPPFQESPVPVMRQKRSVGNGPRSATAAVPLSHA